MKTQQLKRCTKFAYFTENSLNRLIGLMLLLLSSSVLALPTVLLTDSNHITGFELYDKGLFWWSSNGECGGEFVHDATIRLRGIAGGLTKTLNDSCQSLEGEASNVVRDEVYFYYAANGQLVRKAINASVSDQAQAIPNSPAITISPGGTVVALGDGMIYWSDTNTGTGYTFIWQMPVDGSSSAIVKFSLFTDTGNIKKMLFTHHRDSNDVDHESLIILRSNGMLSRHELLPGFGSELLETSVLDFDIHKTYFLFTQTTYVYAAKGTYFPIPGSDPGSLVRVNLRTGSSDIVYQSVDYLHQVLSVGSDSLVFIAIGSPSSKNIYITEGSGSCAGLLCTIVDSSIYRHSVPAGTSGWELIVAGDAGTNLRSDDETLYFTDGDAIWTLATNAPPVIVDFKADSMEVTQVVQNIANDARFVADKRTFVRAYAHVQTDTSGKSVWLPTAELRGYSGDPLVEFPDSPISPVAGASMDMTSDMAVLRPDIDRSYLFELPDAWLAQGDLHLQMTVNPDAILPEVDIASNTISRTINLQQRGKPCFNFVPVAHVDAPIYDPSTAWGFYKIIQRVRTLLPVEDVNIFYHNVMWKSTQGSSFEPFDFYEIIVNGKPKRPEADIAFTRLAEMASQTGNPPGCAGTTWVGALSEKVFTDTGFLGAANASTHVQISVMVEGGGGEDWAKPEGGRIVTHETGHNYNRPHVDCGGAPAPWDNPPWDPCDLGPLGDPLAWYGFDPVTHLVIAPDQARDILTYGTNQWMSSFTWEKLFDEIGGASLAASQINNVDASENSGDMLLLTGELNDLVSISSAQVWPDGTAPAEKITESLGKAAELGSGAPYRVYLRNFAGDLLLDTALVFGMTLDVPNSKSIFSQYVSFDAHTAKVEIVKEGVVLAEIMRSPNSPRVAVYDPVITSDNVLELHWVVYDADGDALQYAIQYSSDDGLSWRTLFNNYRQTSLKLATNQLPGGSAVRMRVIASDGLNTEMDMSNAFYVATNSPKPKIIGVREQTAIAFGRPLRLEGFAADMEDGNLTGSSLSWQLTGPVNKAESKAFLALNDLPPGEYTVQLTASDSDRETGVQITQFKVLPVMVTDRVNPLVDGSCNDAAYQNATMVSISRSDDFPARVWVAHADGKLFVCFADIPFASSLFGISNAVVGMHIDADASGSDVPQADDRGFYVGQDGIPFQSVGNGRAGMSVTLTPSPGVQTSIDWGPTRWSAEFMIPQELIGDWNHVAGLMLFQFTDNTLFGMSNLNPWPENADLDVPNTWSQAYFGETLPTENHAPIADAGGDMQIPMLQSTTVVLDGGESYDPDGDAISYSWIQVYGPDVVLVASDTATPWFQMQDIDSNTELVFELIVNDRSLPGIPDRVTVNLLNVQSKPFISNQDGDLLDDAIDNCIEVVNSDQRDTNNDGYGNVCDPDFNNDLIVNATDLAFFKTKFFTQDADTDLNGDGIVNAGDLAILKSFFFRPPGPSGLVP